MSVFELNPKRKNDQLTAPVWIATLRPDLSTYEYPTLLEENPWLNDNTAVGDNCNPRGANNFDMTYFRSLHALTSQFSSSDENSIGQMHYTFEDGWLLSPVRYSRNNNRFIFEYLHPKPGEAHFSIYDIS